MALTVGAQAQQTYTFNWNNGSASLYDASGGTINSGLHAKWVSNVSPGVTIEVVEGGNSKKLMNTNGRIIINSASEINKIQITAPDGYVVKSYTLKFTGLSADSKTITPESGGNAQTYTNNQVTVTATGIDQQSTYFTMAAASGSWVMSSVQTFSIVIEEVIENAVSVTYKVVDENGTTLTTKTESVTAGTSITSLPASMQHTLFYDYSTENYTAEEGLEATFTATPKDSAPFKFTADATSPVWYFLTLKTDANYVTYIADGEQNVQLPTTNADNETTHWAFIGNPYAGFTIVNEAAGTSLVLGSDATTGSANNGGNVYATLATEGSQTNEVWTVISSSYRTNGFFLQNTEDHRLNMRNGTANVSYWTTGSDAGSTFVATKVPGLAELIPEAETLLSDLTAGANDVQIGYPTADALSTFSSAIDAAKDILNNGGDEATAIAALKAAMKAVKAFESINYTPRTDVYYTITSGRGSMVYDASHSSQVDNIYGNEFLWYTTSLDKTNANHQWGFIKVDGKYYMYNVGKKQFANVTQGGSYQNSNGDKHTWMFSNAPSSVTLDAGEGNWVVAPNVRVRATSEVTGKQYAMSISTGFVGPVIAYDAVNDGGIPMTFAIATTEQDSEVTTAIEALLNDPTPYKEALQEAINEANTFLTNLTNYPIGDGLNQYTMTGDTDALSSAVTAGGSELENADATKESLQAAIQAINEAKEAISLSLNMPTVGKFYRIKTAKAWSETNAEAFNNTQPYLIGENASNNRAAFSTTAGEDASSIWYLTKIDETQYLVNFSNGRPAVNRSNFLGVGKDSEFLPPSGNSGTSIVFKAATNGEIGAYGIVFAAGGRALYTNVNLYTDAAGANGSGAGYNFQLEEVTTLRVTMNDGLDGKYYATFSAPVAISSITGATAHKVKVENEKAKYSETGVEGIPASTGVLLINETGEKATLTIGDFTDAIDTDLQYIFAAETSHEGLFFGLSTENKLGFFKLMEGGETTPTTGGFKAYLNAPASAKGVELVADNETTGIENMENGTLNMENGAVYNLQGQRVVKAQKGVFIQNGKKVVVR